MNTKIPERIALSRLSIGAMICALSPESLIGNILKQSKDYNKEEEPAEPRPLPSKYEEVKKAMIQRFPHCVQEIEDFLSAENKQNAIDQGLDAQHRLIVNSRRDMAWKNFMSLCHQLNIERHNILVREKKAS